MTESKKTYILADNTALRQLVERIGPKQTAQAIGVSASYIHAAVKADKIKLTMELAARHILSKMDRTTHGPCFIVAAVPSNKRDAVESMLTAMDIDYTNLSKFLSK